MNTAINKNSIIEKVIDNTSFRLEKLWQDYMSYADRQAYQKVLWYMITIMIIPMVLMIPSIIAMRSMIDGFEYFIGFSMLLFFANVTVHVVEMKSRVYIPLFHFTIVLFIVIPLVTYFITL